jgi:metal-dependent amidase/aminoacylase/carboxypeptidase family protein
MPELSDTIRDDLLRAPLQVLHAAVSTARVTVSAMSHMVSVAVLADADALPVSETTRCEPSGVTVTYLQEGGDVWVNSIWQRSP